MEDFHCQSWNPVFIYYSNQLPKEGTHYKLIGKNFSLSFIVMGFLRYGCSLNSDPSSLLGYH
jgi:hypothetical protein